MEFHLVPTYYHAPKRKSCAHQAVTSLSCSFSHQSAFYLYGLTLFDVSRNRIHPNMWPLVSGFFPLAKTFLRFIHFASSSSTWFMYSLIVLWSATFCIYIPHFVYPYIHDDHVGCFTFWLLSSAAMNISIVHVLFEYFKFFWVYI